MILNDQTIQKYGYDPSYSKGNTNKIVVVQCDFCKASFEKIYYKFLEGRKVVNLDCCKNKDCVAEKRKQIFIIKYNVEHYSQTDDFKAKLAKTSEIKYGPGINNPFQAEEVKAKIKETILRRFGVENVAKLETIIQKRQKTTQENTGFKASFQNPEIRQKADKTKEYNKQHSSIAELTKFLQSYGTVENNNDILSLSEHNTVAFSIISLKNCNIDKRELYKKFETYKLNNIQLLQFFEDEWHNKRNLCESIIKNKLGLIETKLYARNLHIICVSLENQSLFNDFLSTNHLQGNSGSCIEFGLVDNSNQILSVISLRKPFTKKDVGNIEIARVCTKTNVIVIGGFAKLLTAAIKWCRENNYNIIFTYSDCRYSFGNVYAKNGFIYSGHTDIDYFYTNSKLRFNRFKFRAQPDKPEAQVAEESGVYKVYGAGHYIWTLKL